MSLHNDDDDDDDTAVAAAATAATATAGDDDDDDDDVVVVVCSGRSAKSGSCVCRYTSNLEKSVTYEGPCFWTSRFTLL